MTQTTASFIDQLEQAAAGKEIVLKPVVELIESIEEIIEKPVEEKKELYSGSVDNATQELSSLFENTFGVSVPKEKEEDVISLPDLVAIELNSGEIVEEETQIEPTIDREAIDSATSELMSLFEIMAGVDLETGEKIDQPVEEEVIDIPIPLPTTYSTILNGSRGDNNVAALPTFAPTQLEKQSAAANILLKDWKVDRSRPSSGNLDTDKNAHAAKVITDVTSLLEKHREELPEEEFKTLESEAVDKTVDYINELRLDEDETYTNTQSMPFTGANMPLVSNAGFTFAVGNILRKMMATGPGSGVTEVSKLDDIDDATLTEGYVLAYQPNVAPTNLPYKWQSPLTPPAGDINDIVTAANSGLEGGANSGTVTLTVDASNLPALGAPVALTDYVVIYDADASATKKVLVSNFSSGDITSVTAGDGLTVGGLSGAVELDAVGTADRISVGANAIDIASTYVGQETITTLGTVATGTWQGTAVANAYLGPGINATKLADGTVTNTELQYINTLSSNAQTQITNVKTTADAAASKGFAIAMGVALG